MFAGSVTDISGPTMEWTPNRLVYEYDPATNRWSKKRPLPLPFHHMAIAVCNEKVYTFGGFVPPPSGLDAWVPIEHAWEYDPAADSWKAIAPLPRKRGAAAATVVNGKIFVVGGGEHPERTRGRQPSAWDPHCSSGLVYQYDPATDRYEQKAAMLIPRNHHRLEAVGGRIYAIGGRVGSSTTRFANMIDLVEEYDPATDSWDPAKARMRYARSSMTSGVRNGLIYIAGGAGAPAVEAYDPAADQWTQVAQMHVARAGIGGAIIGNRFHIVSGRVGTSTGTEPVADHDALQLE